jgi:hypothetical protein
MTVHNVLIDTDNPYPSYEDVGDDESILTVLFSILFSFDNSQPRLDFRRKELALMHLAATKA